MWSVSRSALLPSSVTVWPFTVTRPCVISSSALRREETPAAAMIFCNRSAATLTSGALSGNLFGGLLVGLIVPRIRRDCRFGDVLRDLGLVLRHLLNSAILIRSSGCIGNCILPGLEQLVLQLARGQLLELFQAGQLAQVAQSKAQQKI